MFVSFLQALRQRPIHIRDWNSFFLVTMCLVQGNLKRSCCSPFSESIGNEVRVDGLCESETGPMRSHFGRNLPKPTSETIENEYTPYKGNTRTFSSMQVMDHIAECANTLGHRAICENAMSLLRAHDCTLSSQVAIGKTQLRKLSS